MRCPSCNHDNRPDRRFCTECGAPLSAACPSCGGPVEGGEKFCGRCGSALTPRLTRASPRPPATSTPNHLADKILGSRAALEGERKQVTVLFADVQGSMELAEQLDPEEWSAIMQRFFRILADGIERFDGFVDKFTGDGIMALFGAPIAHEDHAQRACWAALHLRDTLKAYADELRVEHGLNFSVRMGMNSGDVVVGGIGDDLRMDYTAQGLTVGLAQRMEALAEPGKAMLAGATIDIVRGYFALRDLGAMKVKGIDTPVHVAELEGIGRMRTRLDRSRARGLSKFVGRDEETERLETALRRSLDGDGQVVGVMAEAGSGKSRLCFEFLERCRARGISVRSCTGVAHGHAVPFQPILDFYSEIFGGTPEDTEVQIRQKIAGSVAQTAPEELASLPLLFDFMRVPDPARPAPEMAPDERRQAMMAILRRLTAARSRHEPAVLMFEDLHWFDPDSEAIVESLVDAAVNTRTLVLLNFRPEYQARWVGRTHYQQLALRPLGVAAAGELLGDWLGPDPSVAGFVDLVCERTGGNPFFMEEVVQAQIESGSLTGTRGHYRLEAPIESIEVPASVQSLLAARIDRLDEAGKRLLQAAAVIGDEVPEPLLARVAGREPEVLRNSVRSLVQSEFLYEATLYPESEYAFKHPLTREVAYASLLRERRQALHAEVARALELLPVESVEQRAPLLAHHWEHAGQALEAARWQARIAARLRMNTNEAVFHWRKVTELLKAEDETPETSELLDTAYGRLVYAASRTTAPDVEVEALFAAALRRFGDTDSREHAWTLMSYAFVRSGAGSSSQAYRLGAQALEMARRLDDRALTAAVLWGNLAIRGPMEFPDDIDRFVVEIDRLCSADPCLGVELGGQRPWLVARLWRVLTHLRRGQGAGVDELVAEICRGMSDDDGASDHAVFHCILAMVRALRGDPTGALEHGRQALEWAKRSGNVAMYGIGYASYGEGLLSAGRLDEALQNLQQAALLALDRALLKGFGCWQILPLLAETQLRRGDTAAARTAAERGIAVARSMGYRYSEAKNLIALAQALVADGDVANADVVLAGALDLAQALKARDLLPRIEEARAQLAQRRGDIAGSEWAWRAAARIYRENGEEWLAAQAETSIQPSKVT